MRYFFLLILFLFSLSLQAQEDDLDILVCSCYYQNFADNSSFVYFEESTLKFSNGHSIQENLTGTDVDVFAKRGDRGGEILYLIGFKKALSTPDSIVMVSALAEVGTVRSKFGQESYTLTCRRRDLPENLN